VIVELIEEADRVTEMLASLDWRTDAKTVQAEIDTIPTSMQYGHHDAERQSNECCGMKA